ncbi:DNA starvation/stationary phase protection protein Dps [Haloarcula salinisoli]|uniref:DNA starvation/stationary phase protection protein Dps n=1 Tax=Haloarcula salinisoli TaxID=2487746 RepID=A0A8J7YN94_9EURY|nr:DNA starvation/stationary phase protection protein Dps [Halomicroarcula salinisoli]MBX0305884.1 DNA starvation/stationary phase protection protein Dps [Halomicroarcula salinisoli]
MSQSQQSIQQQPSTASRPTGAGQSQPPSTMGGQQFPVRSNLPDEVRATSIDLLNQTLADLSAVTMQLKHAHWNVKGIEFYQLHELFEDLYEDFEPHIDAVAERASALGGRPIGTAGAVAQQTTIPPLSHDRVDGQSMLREVADRLAVLDANLYQHIETANQQGDLDTADLLNEVSRDVTKAQWFVESHLQVPQSQGGQQRGAPQQGAPAQQR